MLLIDYPKIANFHVPISINTQLDIVKTSTEVITLIAPMLHKPPQNTCYDNYNPQLDSLSKQGQGPQQKLREHTQILNCKRDGN